MITKKTTATTKTPGKKTTLPFKQFSKPMLATLVDKPFDREGWLYEVKWDGYRALAFVNKKKVEIRSRNDKSFNDKFYPVAKALQALHKEVILDGEIVVLGENGISNFNMLQNWRSEADGQLFYYVFDILWLNGKSLIDLPLTKRKEILKKNIKETELIRISDAFDEPGINFFEAAKKMGLEGIIAKKADSQYLPGLRTQDWLKIKSNKRQEMVIGGYTINDDTSKQFSSLLVGVFKGDKFIYTGKVGTGFNDKMQQTILSKLKPLLSKKPPFNEVPDVNKPSRFRPDPPHATAYWVKPKIVCEVSFAEMTADGVMRHPSFEGLRTDKNANEVVKEKEKPVSKVIRATKKTAALIKRPLASRSKPVKGKS